MWPIVWCLGFNFEKCKVLHIGKQNPKINYNFGGHSLSIVNNEKDLGVIFNRQFTFKDHVAMSIAKAKQVISWILRTIVSRHKEVMVPLFKTFILPHLEYCTQAWSPVPGHGGWGIIHAIEDIQRKFTKQIDGLSNLSYDQRLKRLNLTTLLERRMRGDLIELNKILNNFANYGKIYVNFNNLLKFGQSVRSLTIRQSFTN